MSDKLAKLCVQEVTGTIGVKIALRPNPTVIANFLDPNFTAVRYAQNFVTGTNRTITSWNSLPMEVKQEFLVLYNEKTWDDPFEDRVQHILRSAHLMIAHFKKNPYEMDLAARKAELEERIAAHEALVKASEKKQKKPARPSMMARDFKRLKDKAKKWSYKPEYDCKKIEKFVRIHDQMRMFSTWGGSKLGRKSPHTRAYVYHPSNLAYPTDSNKNGDKPFGWPPFVRCLLDEKNLDRVIGSGERLDRIEDAYSECIEKGIKRFSDANAKYLKYLSAKKSGRSCRKVGPPKIKSENLSL